MGMVLTDISTCPVGSIYRLQAVVFHGKNHYVAAVANPVAGEDDAWHFFDDASVQPYSAWDELAASVQAGMHPILLLFAREPQDT